MQPYVIPEVGKMQINDIRMDRNGPHNYNTRSGTKRVNHVTTFKTVPNMFKMDAEKNYNTYRHILPFSHRPPPKKITVEPLANHINYETTGGDIRIQRPS